MPTIKLKINGEDLKKKLHIENGKDYVLTEKDKQDIAKGIKVPIVTKEIETIIKEQPIVTNEVKEVAMYEEPLQIKDKLESLMGEERLSATAIKDLPEFIQKNPNGGGWRNLFQLHDVAITGTPTNGQVLKYNSALKLWVNGTDAAGTGDVVGPSSAINNDIAVFDGTTGKLIKDSGTTIASLIGPYWKTDGSSSPATGDWNMGLDNKLYFGPTSYISGVNAFGRLTIVPAVIGGFQTLDIGDQSQFAFRFRVRTLGTGGQWIYDGSIGNGQWNFASGSVAFDGGTFISDGGGNIKLTSIQDNLGSSLTSIDPNSRMLYANDGTTANLDWSNPGRLLVNGATDDTSSALQVLGATSLDGGAIKTDSFGNISLVSTAQAAVGSNYATISMQGIGPLGNEGSANVFSFSNIYAFGGRFAVEQDGNGDWRPNIQASHIGVTDNVDLTLQNSGSLLVGSLTPDGSGAKLQVAGSINAYGDTTGDIALTLTNTNVAGGATRLILDNATGGGGDYVDFKIDGVNNYQFGYQANTFPDGGPYNSFFFYDNTLSSYIFQWETNTDTGRGTFYIPAGEFQVTGAVYFNGSQTVAGTDSNFVIDSGGAVTAMTFRATDVAKFEFAATGAATDEKWWQIYAGNDSVLHFSVINDALSFAPDWMTVTRTGDSPKLLNLMPYSGRVGIGAITDDTTSALQVLGNTSLLGTLSVSTGNYSFSFDNYAHAYSTLAADSGRYYIGGSDQGADYAYFGYETNTGGTGLINTSNLTVLQWQQFGNPSNFINWLSYDHGSTSVTVGATSLTVGGPVIVNEPTPDYFFKGIVQSITTPFTDPGYDPHLMGFLSVVSGGGGLAAAGYTDGSFGSAPLIFEGTSGATFSTTEQANIQFRAWTWDGGGGHIELPDGDVAFQFWNGNGNAGQPPIMEWIAGDVASGQGGRVLINTLTDDPNAVLRIGGKTNTSQLRISSPNTPLSPDEAGQAGDVAWDSDWWYVCVATDTWKRVALSTWEADLGTETGDTLETESGDNIILE